MTETWGQWFRANFDKFLLLLLFSFLISLVYHSMHSKDVDPSMVNWFREAANTIMGTLIGLITGVSIASRREPPPGTVSQTTVKTTVQEAPAADPNA